jgi:hypothetical protein
MRWRITAAPKVVSPLPVIRPGPRPMASMAAPQAAVSLRPEPETKLNPALTRASFSVLRPQVPTVAAPAVSAATLARLDVMPDLHVIPRPIVQEPAVVPPPRPVTATQLGATFRYRRVSIQRQWMDSTIFRLPGWSIGGLVAGSISNGRTDSNPGILPLLPVAFIAVKDVSISGAWSDSDKAAASAALSGGTIASFGPFVLTGAVFDGATLKVPGIMIIAWICEVMPTLPPA